MSALSPREAYRLWAPTYANETAISFLDEELVTALSPTPTGKRLLDAGCGTGRRLGRCNAAFAAGIDLSPEMLAAGGIANAAAADVRALPFGNASFDIVWCRLVLGHLADPLSAYRELARVCTPCGSLLVTDFHADAVAAGHRRTFRDRTGAQYEIEHHVHDHSYLASSVGFSLMDELEGSIGPSVESFYIQAGRRDGYARDKGLAVVSAFLFQRTG